MNHTTVVQPEAAAEPPPLLRQPEFLKLWAAQSISQLGDQVTLLALPLVAVLTLDASAAQMGFLVAAELSPHLLFSLFAGVWIDRRARRRCRSRGCPHRAGCGRR